jgi:hypothetical protein
VTVAVYSWQVVARKQKGIPETMLEVSMSWVVQLTSALRVETAGHNCAQFAV